MKDFSRDDSKKKTFVSLTNALLVVGNEPALEQLADYLNADYKKIEEQMAQSNTEPIIRVYSEASTMQAADEIGKKIMDVVYAMK